MGAVNCRLVWEGHQLLHRIPHLGRRALEEPSAAQDEQGVPNEYKLVGREVECDMALSVPPHVDDLGLMSTEVDRVTLINGNIDAGNAVLLSPRADNLAIGFFLQSEVSTCVIWMPVRIENMGEGPATPIEGREDRRFLRRVDGSGTFALRIMEQVAVVVAERAKLLDLEAVVSVRQHYMASGCCGRLHSDLAHMSVEVRR